MARQDEHYVTQEELGAALDYAIDVLDTIRAAVRGATCQDNRITFRVPIPQWYDRIGLAVGGRGGCGPCSRP